MSIRQSSYFPFYTTSLFVCSRDVEGVTCNIRLPFCVYGSKKSGVSAKRKHTTSGELVQGRALESPSRYSLQPFKGKEVSELGSRMRGVNMRRSSLFPLRVAAAWNVQF